MRHATATLAAAALLTLSSCADQKPHSAAARQPYTSVHETTTGTTGSADLIIPGATKTQAQAAIREHASTLDGYELYYLKVMHSPDAQRYVCRARWYAGPDAYLTHSGNTEAWPDSWPHLAVNCP